MEQKVRYCDGYYPGQLIGANDIERSIYMAIGVRLRVY
jgi:hypothetical protein